MNIQTVRLIPVTDVLEGPLWDYICDAPWNFGDCNRSLITIDRFVRFFENYPHDEQLVQVLETLSLMPADVYIDLEN